MESNYLGSAIRELRKKKKMTLDELADGICSKRQLQRIETNINIPSSALMAQLSRKLNENIENYYLYSDSQTPLSLAQKVVHINKMFRDHKYNKAYHEINELLCCEELSDELKQSIGVIQGYSALYSKTITSPTPKYYQDLISLTCKFESLDELCSGFRTLTEYAIIFSLIYETYVRPIKPENAEHHKKDLTEAFALIVKLCRSWEESYKKLDPDFSGYILAHLGYISFLLADYETVIEISNEAIQRFSKTMDIYILASLNHNLAIAHLKLGNQNKSTKYFEYFILLHELKNTSHFVKDNIYELNATNYLTYFSQ